MPNRVELSAAAEEDLLEIFSWGLVQYGDRQAQAYAVVISERLATIAAFPKSFPEDVNLQPPQRVALAGQHIILYEYESARILVTRIRHHAEDWR